MDRLSILLKKNTLLILVISLFPFVLKAQETVTDYDGNVYQTVTIGSQVWMKENLKTTHYNDGTAIPNVTDGTAWAALTTDAYCWYDNDSPTNKAIYGALYNWYTINTGKLCPMGWHVPTDAEWKILTDSLGGESAASGKLKETGYAHWQRPNSGADNISGFTALPGGNRWIDGTFYDNGSLGYWWSSAVFSSSDAWYRTMYYNSSNVNRDKSNKDNGFSVRCIKNASTDVNDSKDKTQIPNEMKLNQNYPNPFNPSTVISYQSSISGNVKLTIYNILGQKIKTLVNSFQGVGEHSLIWDATDESNNPVSSGIYLYKLETNNCAF